MNPRCLAIICIGCETEVLVFCARNPLAICKRPPIFEHAYQETKNSTALAFVRPHDIEIHKVRNGDAPAFEAVVRHIHAIGSLVRLELQRADQAELIEAELTQERFRELNLAQGEHVFIYPRNVRVFLEGQAA